MSAKPRMGVGVGIQNMIISPNDRVNSEQPDLDRQALANLRAVFDDEPDNGFAWRLAATVYGRQGDKGMTSLAMAESALAGGRHQEAQAHAKRALDLLPTGSPGWIRADDVFNASEREAAKSR